MWIVNCELCKVNITIGIADDYKIFRDGLKLCFNTDPNLNVIREADNGEELMEALKLQQPDIIIMDLNMPLLDGMEATKQIRKKYEQVRIKL